MTELAQRLNELALANSNGFLDDDEYRILRQNAFEEHSVSVALPTETPIVPISPSLDFHFRLHTPVLSPSELPETPKPTPSPSRPKLTIPLGVTNLLSKASGRRTPKHTRDPTSSTPVPREGRSISKPSTPGLESPSGTLKLSAMIPKLLQRRPPYRRPTETPRPLTDALNASRTMGTSKFLPRQPPISPQSANFPEVEATNKSSFSLHLDIPQDSRPISPVHHKETDIFSDDNLSTSTDVRIALSKTEDELRKLIDAFHALEARTQRQILKQKADRLPTTTPASVDVLLQGKEWREHRRIPSIPRSAPLLDSSYRYLFASPTRDSLASDGNSLRSGSSNRTDLSQPRSATSLHRMGSSSRSTPLTGGSPLQVSILPHANGKRNLAPPRKDSVSSTTTSVSSFKSRTNRNESLLPPSPGRTPAGNMRYSSMLSRSRNQLGLQNLKGSSWMFSEETLLSFSSSSREETGYAGSTVSSSRGQGNSETKIENDPALIDIRRRKERLIARYNARLEFLRAKLKSAELHERLLRK